MPITEAAFEALRVRVTAVEQSIAVREETLKTITDCLVKIETILSRLTWLMISSIITAAMTFGEFPLVLIAIRQSPGDPSASTCLAKIRSKS